MNVEMRTCTKCGVTRPITEYYVNKNTGWVWRSCKKCHNEYTRARHEATKKPPKVRVKRILGPCSFEGCEKTESSRGLCSGHYQQNLLGRELTPLQKVEKSYINDDWRKCTCCMTVKQTSEFHRRSGPGYQSFCKTCMSLTNSIDTLIRQGRLEEAMSRAVTVPEARREKYVGKVTQAIKESELER